MEPDPPTLDYRRPPAPPRRGPLGLTSVGKYALGVFAGLAISLGYYFVLARVGADTFVELFGAVLFKLVVGVALLFVESWRAFGLGLVTSVPIAVLIFMGICFGTLGS